MAALSTLLLLASQLAHAGPPSVKIGGPALQFTLSAINEEAAVAVSGKPSVALSDFAGITPVNQADLVLLWFFDKAHGGDALEALERVAKHYRSQKVQIIAISADNAEIAAVSNWITPMNLSYPVLRDQYRVVHGRYGASELPLAVVVNGEGDVLALGRPPADTAESELTDTLDALMGQ